jgi:hypothetical protein
MYFVIGFPRTFRKYDAIMVVVHNLSKEAHLILIKSTFKAIYVANIFMKENFILHGLLKTIILYKDSKFTSSFWKILFAGLVM